MSAKSVNMQMNIYHSMFCLSCMFCFHLHHNQSILQNQSSQKMLKVSPFGTCTNAIHACHTTWSWITSYSHNISVHHSIADMCILLCIATLLYNICFQQAHEFIWRQLSWIWLKDIRIGCKPVNLCTRIRWKRRLTCWRPSLLSAGFAEQYVPSRVCIVDIGCRWMLLKI